MFKNDKSPHTYIHKIADRLKGKDTHLCLSLTSLFTWLLGQIKDTEEIKHRLGRGE
ncbi:hypothetical protein J5S49_16455 [Virgibacillus halodenitrificans]|uniref:hypothetical protein n=1 Tax=Virgibacillus halodenitrificans TaxID=1482 RepID=UPI000AB96432|nr:hypothetical protein [Virgibacillus halodenitrificans]MCG1029874.1 hypothetical protein [Virgibacillus halodenitrificans]